MSDPVQVPVVDAAELVPFGWSELIAGDFAPHHEGGAQPGRVVAVHRGGIVIRLAEGEVMASQAGRLPTAGRDEAARPAVGDWVAVDQPPGGDTVIRAVLPRRSALVRTTRASGRRSGTGAGGRQVLAANVDVAFVVDSFDGGPNIRRLERYLALAWSSEAQPVVVLNKMDLLAGEVAAAEAIQIVAAVAPGVAVLLTSAASGEGMAAIEAAIAAGRTAVVVGPSGVGKSTIVNQLLGEHRQATGRVRLGDGRGRHTTTVRQLFVTRGGGLVIDTPGIRSLELAGDESAIDLAFDDVAALAQGCRFADCRHQQEPGCALRAAVEAGTLPVARVANALKLVEEARRRAEEGVEAAREQRRRGRTLSRAVRQHRRLEERGPG